MACAALLHDAVEDHAADRPRRSAGGLAMLAGRLGVRAADLVAAGEPPDLKEDEHFLASGRSISQPPLVAAVHTPRHYAAPSAGGRIGTGPGHHAHRPPRRIDALDGQASQMRNQDGNSLKIARRT